MTVAEFMGHLSGIEKTGLPRPSRVTLGLRALDGIYDEILSSGAPCAISAEDMSSAAVVARENGYCMTLLGVDVYRDPSLRGEEFKVTA